MYSVAHLGNERLETGMCYPESPLKVDTPCELSGHNS